MKRDPTAPPPISVRAVVARRSAADPACAVVAIGAPSAVYAVRSARTCCEMRPSTSASGVITSTTPTGVFRLHQRPDRDERRARLKITSSREAAAARAVALRASPGRSHGIPRLLATGRGAPFERTANTHRPFGRTTSTIGTPEFACSGVTSRLSAVGVGRSRAPVATPAVKVIERSAVSCSASTVTSAASVPGAGVAQARVEVAEDALPCALAGPDDREHGDEQAEHEMQPACCAVPAAGGAA